MGLSKVGVATVMTEHLALLSCLSALTETFQHTLSLSAKLLEKGLITREVHGWQLDALGVSNHDKAARLLACVTDRVKGSSQLYYVFLDILKEEVYFKDVVEKICAEHSKSAPVINTHAERFYAEIISHEFIHTR